jgi:dGTPase
MRRQSELARFHHLNQDVVETACLAHDLGHPPFGHLAEEELNRLVGDEAQGFEGNAQSFRIVTELAFRDDGYSGLNLTNRSLRAILKYPWTFSARPKKKQDKWGAYDSELGSFRLAFKKSETEPYHRSAEAELMDWSDDLTYAIHDIEDFYRAGLIPLHLLLPPAPGSQSSAERERFLQYVASKDKKPDELRDVSEADLDEILAGILFTNFMLTGPYEGKRQERARLRIFTSRLVGRYINGLQLVEPSDTGEAVHVDEDLRKQIALLKQLTWYYVIDAAGLGVQQHAHRQVINYLFGVFHEETKKSPSRLLPPYYRERLEKAGESASAVRRVIADLIAGMTETQCLLMYQRLNGLVPGSALDKLIV